MEICRNAKDIQHSLKFAKPNKAFILQFINSFASSLLGRCCCEEVQARRTGDRAGAGIQFRSFAARSAPKVNIDTSTLPKTWMRPT